MEGITYVLYMYLRGLITGIEKVCWGGGGGLLLDVLVSLSHKHLFTCSMQRKWCLIARG